MAQSGLFISTREHFESIQTILLIIIGTHTCFLFVCLFVCLLVCLGLHNFHHQRKMMQLFHKDEKNCLHFEFMIDYARTSPTNI